MPTDQPLPSDIKLRHETQAEHSLEWHWPRKGLSAHFASAACKILDFFANRFFRKRYGHRAVLLETIAAVPGMVGAMFNHLSSLRKIKHDHGRIRVLMDEAENERMHLMTFIEIAKPTPVERGIILSAQGMFFTFYSLAYIFNKQVAHRFVGLIEEGAIQSYTSYLEEIDKGNIKNVAAPALARKYWNLKEDATLRDVVIAVRADEVEHRDVNHRFADELTARKEEVKAMRLQKRKEFMKKVSSHLPFRKAA